MLLRAVVAALPSDEVMKQLAAEGTPARLRPHAIATSRGHMECAAVLAELSDASHDDESAWDAGLTTAPGVETPAVVEAAAEASATETGGWLAFDPSEPPAGIPVSAGGCDFAVEPPTLDADRFAHEYVVRERPVLIRNGTAAQWASLRALLAKQALTDGYGDLPVHVGAAPYYEAASTRATTLRSYADALETGGVSDGPVEYLFLGLYGRTDASEGLEGRLREELQARLPELVGETVRRRHLFYTASMQFSLGRAGAGSPPHYHMAAINTLVYGRKRWTLLPPRDAVYSALPVREWHKAGGVEGLRAEGRRVLECTQRPGDLVYVPDHWGHAVINEALSVGFATEVATARGHAMRIEL